MVFALVWLTIVYFPIAHMVWAASGYFFKAGALDFAGGTVVHINAGVSALVFALILGKRIGYPTERMAPHSLTLTASAPACCGSAGSASTPAPRSRRTVRPPSR